MGCPGPARLTTHNRATREKPGFGADPAFREKPGAVTKPGCPGPGENPGLHPKRTSCDCGLAAGLSIQSVGRLNQWIPNTRHFP